jgi:FixJ family two-component response regulator
MLRSGTNNRGPHQHVHLEGLGDPSEPQQAHSQGLESYPGRFAGPAVDRSDFTIFLIDDDPSVLRSLSSLLRAAGYKIETFSSAIEFIAHYDESVPGCLISDVCMPGLDGLRLYANLSARGVQKPTIFITGRGDVPMSVRAMKAGAVDFLTKPVPEDDLFAAIARAEKKETEARRIRDELASIKAKLSTLTQREQEVLTRVVAGRLNKQIAFELGIGEKTIKVHRGRMMRKISVRTVAELVRLIDRAGIGSEPSYEHQRGLVALPC